MFPDKLPSKVVSLLEILQAYVQAYAVGMDCLGLDLIVIQQETQQGRDFRLNGALLNRLRGHLDTLLPHCEHLPMTALSVRNFIKLIDSPNMFAQWTQAEMAFLSSIREVQTRLTDELSLNLFFTLPASKKQFFDSPLLGWEEVIARFPETVSNIEEMSKCFALSRYAASVFHSVRAIESALIHLGKFLGVVDPLSGWTAVTSRLETLVVKTKHPDRPPQYQVCSNFLEQMNAVTQALKSAWRNKISHAQGSLILMTVDFSPDIAEEIMIASRSFMRRLATEMP
jgi:hypothetical protein